MHKNAMFLVLIVDDAEPEIAEKKNVQRRHMPTSKCAMREIEICISTYKGYPK